MRFAEKMLLNAKFYPLVRLARHWDGARCALGLVEEGHICYGIADLVAEQLFPWISEVSLPYPCGCSWHPLCGSERAPVNAIIAQIFNEHVIDRREPVWTLERLADWIDSIDPTPRTPEVKAVESIGIRDGQMVVR
jgi:hypothetical protein